MKKQDIKQLLEKISADQYTPEEEAMAKYWLHRLNQNNPSDLSDEDLDQARDAMWQSIQASKIPKSYHTKQIWLRVSAAACLVFGLAVGGFFVFHNKQVVHSYTAKTTKQELLPGSNGAILTLANGKKLVLEQTKAGVIIQQNGINLRKAGDSLLVYKADGTNAPSAGIIEYNILETPRGKQYSVMLPDGSKAWLNAGSSLKYPTAFAGNERLVELRGEAYFQVVHNSKMPFRVKTDKQVIEDIGTQFNVNAYVDEKVIQTTLVEGSVKVMQTGLNGFKILKPGQKSSNDGTAITVSGVNTDAETAWKDGLFMFDNTDIHDVMKQIKRWYNAEIIYDDEPIDAFFTGVLPRSSDLQTVLSMLASTRRVEFNIKGNLITVHKK